MSVGSIWKKNLAIEKVFKTFAKAFNSEAAGDNIDKNTDKKEVTVFSYYHQN